MQCVSFLSLFCHFFGAPSIFLGQAWADGKGKLATCRHRADSGGETVKNVRRHSLDRLHASMIKQKTITMDPDIPTPISFRYSHQRSAGS